MLSAHDLIGKTFWHHNHLVKLKVSLEQITGHGSWAHGFLKDAVCANFRVFKFKPGLTEEIKEYNQSLQASLLRDDAFHHKVFKYLVLQHCTDPILRTWKCLKGLVNTASLSTYFKTCFLLTPGLMASSSANISILSLSISLRLSSQW